MNKHKNLNQQISEIKTDPKNTNINSDTSEKEEKSYEEIVQELLQQESQKKKDLLKKRKAKIRSIEKKQIEELLKYAPLEEWIRLMNYINEEPGNYENFKQQIKNFSKDKGSK